MAINVSAMDYVVRDFHRMMMQSAARRVLETPSQKTGAEVGSLTIPTTHPPYYANLRSNTDAAKMSFARFKRLMMLWDRSYHK